MSTIYTRAGKGSALTWTEGDANITNLNNDKIEDIVEDTSPQLGGNLDVNGNKIVSTSNGNIALEPNGSGKVTATTNIETTGDVKGKELFSTNSSGDEGGQINLAKPASGTTISGAGIIIDVYQNKLRIFEEGGSARGAYIDITSAGSSVGTNLLSGGGGATTLDGLSDVNTAGVSNNHVLKYNSIASEWQSSLLDVPTTLDSLTDVSTSGASDNQLLSYNSGTSSWQPRTVTAGISSVSSDATPMLGGDLDVNGKTILSTSNGNINIVPNGTGKIQLDAVYWPTTDGTSNQVLKTDGAGNLSWTTVSSGGIASVSADTAPVLGGVLDVADHRIENITGTTGGINLADGIIAIGKEELTSGNTYIGSYRQHIRIQADITGSYNGGAYFEARYGTNGNAYISTPGTGVIYLNAGGKVVIDGLSWPTSDGTANQVLKTDGSGNLSWTTPSGGSTVSVAMLYCNPYQLGHTSLYEYSGGNYRLNFYEASDANNIVTTTNGQFTLGAGTYTVLLSGPLGFDQDSTGVLFYNSTSSSTIYEWFIPALEWGNSNNYSILSSYNYVVSPGSSTTYEYRLPSLSNTTTQGAFTLIITKLA